MIIKGILFDVNGTLVDINTDEGLEEIYRAISHFLTYQGINLHRWEVRDIFYRLMDQQQNASTEKYPEFDVVALWREFLLLFPNAGTISRDKMAYLPQFLAEVFRGISRRRLELYPDVIPVLEALQPRYKMAVVSDAQTPWALPELRALGIEFFFAPIIVSGDYGFKKPDPRLFEAALSAMDLSVDEVLFVGNDMYRDVYGAQAVGMKAVFFSSNQGRKEMDGVNPDYIIYHFKELHDAIRFFEKTPEIG